VDTILRHRVSRGKKLEFLIRWKNYDPSDDTWEPEANLAGAQDLLREYKAVHGL
jgi:chromobox protein 1